MSTEPNPTPSDPQAGYPSGSAGNAPRERGPRVSTVLWGALILLASAYLLFPLVFGAPIDLQLAVIVALAVAGGALLLAAIVGAIRRR